MATIKQQIAIRKLSEIIRNNKGQKHISMGEILREAGYSESVSKSPQRVTQSKGWNELIDELFPDSTLLQTHKKLINKQEVFSYKGDIIKTGQPHSDVKQALEMIYKLKGRYSYEEKPTTDEEDDLSILSNEELRTYEKIIDKLATQDELEKSES